VSGIISLKIVRRGCDGSSMERQVVRPKVIVLAAERAPLLSMHCKSSVPGLLFAGPATTNVSGPLTRFVVGMEFTARQSVNHLAPRAGSRRPLRLHRASGAGASHL
jgi:hypothetical protein